MPAGLEALQRLAEEAGAEDIVAEAAALRGRLAEGRFHVACLGQLKRGKSTLLNALVGEPVLPVGVVPVTSALTILRHGAERTARVTFGDGGSRTVDLRDVGAYVAEEHNPENAKGVAAVEVTLPSPLLASGTCLVDTPGVGSVFAGNTAVTREFLPHVDAAIVVLGADPPMSGEELAMIEVVARETRAILAVLNKADRLSASDLAEARAFAARVIAGRVGRDVPLFEVSATERVALGPTREWATFEHALEAIARTSGDELVLRAHARGLRRLADQLLADLDEQIGALTRPREASERRIEALRAAGRDAERSLRDLAPLFDAEQRALAKTFDEQRRRLLAAAPAEARAELDRGVDALGDDRHRLRERAAELARTIAAQRVERWAAEVEPLGEALYRQATERFVALVGSVVERLGASADPDLGGLPREVVPASGFRAKRRFHFHDLLTLQEPSVVTRLADAVRTRGALVDAVKKGAGEYLERLVSTNSARIANDLAERVQESRRGVEAELSTMLRDTVAAAERSLERAQQRHRDGERAVQAELGRLRDLHRRASSLRALG